MGKKTKKKQKHKGKKGYNNTILVTIMLIIILIVGCVEMFLYVYTRDVIKDVQTSYIVKFISNVKVFNIDMNKKDYASIRRNLNDIFMDDIKIKHIMITDNNKKELYNSLPKGSVYSYTVPDNLSSLKFIKIPDLNMKEYRTIYINKVNTNVYMLVSDEGNIILANMTGFMKMFFAIIMLLCVIISYFIARSISSPLLKMEKTVSKIAEGDLSQRLEETKYYELNRLVQAYNIMVNALQRLYSSLEVKVQDRTKELKSAYAELQNTQAMMVHSEKMKSLGELVAGIMHEINNPINFIYGNMTHLGNYSNDLIEIIEKYTQYEASLKDEEKKDVEKIKEDIDYEFLKTDMPDLIKSCKEGADRAKNIIQDLKSFSRMEEVSIKKIDLPHEIDMTLNILHNKLKNKAEIHKEYAENIPLVEAYGGQLNQVFMNILDNAVGAIKDKGDIWIRLLPEENNNKMVIEIEDNGMGMDEETARKVFNPFFTTKPVGQGTGLGMSITYKIIKNHQGDIKVESTPNVGTKFIITIPIVMKKEESEPVIANGGEDGQV